MPRRRADKVDNNQTSIVDELRAIGASVETNHDDLLVGFNNRNYWFEVKNDPRHYVLFSQLKPYQRSLTKNYKGQYHVITNSEQAKQIMGANVAA